MSVKAVLVPDPKLATPVRLVIKEPVTSSVVFVLLMEADAWEIDGAHAHEIEGDPETPIAMLIGEIKDTQFKLLGAFVGPAAPFGPLLMFVLPLFPLPQLIAKVFRTADQLKTAPTDPNQNVLALQIDGDSATFFLPFKDNDFSREGGYFEVLLAIAADSGPGNQAESFVSKVPAFVRSIPKARRVAAFITSPPEAPNDPNPFFRLARRYWRQVTDRIEDIFDLADIFDFLRDHATDAPAAPWGEVNIVAHANERTWGVRAFSNSPSARTGTKDIRNLSKEPRSPFFEKFRESVMDQSSIVVLRGCQVGRDQFLLDALRELFGGNATIFAPKFIQEYSETKTGIIESFLENFFFTVPGKTSPSLSQCQQRIASENPPLTVKEVAAMDRHPDNLEHQDVGFTRGGKFDDELDTKSDAEIAAILLPKVEEDFDDDETEFTDWGQWTAQEVKRAPNTTKPKLIEVQSVMMRGFLTRVEFRRPLKHIVNGQSVLVVPNIHNPDHYGRSPAF